ncbi:MAG: NAD-dependent dehydratase, partial [Candidatus Sericytochromatia bacterium]|nr:NAD-dependent dehydratase [Candidatus Sericytochromatia bacterium]
DLFHTACKVLGVTATVREDAQRLRPAASEVQVLLSDPGRARERLGWQAQVSLADGLARTAEWLQAHLSLYRTEGYHV